MNEETERLLRQRTEHLVGRTQDGDRYVVEIEVRQVRRPGMQTVAHEEIDSIDEVSISGLTIRKHSRQIWSAGQNLDTIWDVLADDGSPIWPVTDLMSLWAIWREWHLNSMKAACLHNSEQQKTCYRSGYMYGTAWLVVPAPQTVIGELARLKQHEQFDSEGLT